jgi:hypothetical protein
VRFAGGAVTTRARGRAGRASSRALRRPTWNAIPSPGRIVETGAGTVLTGHGPPWTEGAAAAAERAAAAGSA